MTASVVPRAWTLAWGVLSGQTLADSLPDAVAAAYTPALLHDDLPAPIEPEQRAWARRRNEQTVIELGDLVRNTDRLLDGRGNMRSGLASVLTTSGDHEGRPYGFMVLRLDRRPCILSSFALCRVGFAGVDGSHFGGRGRFLQRAHACFLFHLQLACVLKHGL